MLDHRAHDGVVHVLDAELADRAFADEPLRDFADHTLARVALAIEHQRSLVVRMARKQIAEKLLQKVVLVAGVAEPVVQALEPGWRGLRRAQPRVIIVRDHRIQHILWRMRANRARRHVDDPVADRDLMRTDPPPRELWVMAGRAYMRDHLVAQARAPAAVLEHERSHGRLRALDPMPSVAVVLVYDPGRVLDEAPRGHRLLGQILRALRAALRRPVGLGVAGVARVRNALPIRAHAAASARGRATAIRGRGVR